MQRQGEGEGQRSVCMGWGDFTASRLQVLRKHGTDATCGPCTGSQAADFKKTECMEVPPKMLLAQGHQVAVRAPQHDM